MQDEASAVVITLTLLTQLLTGAVLGLIISTTGVGGGILILPVLTWMFGMDALSAVATANLMSMLMKLSSSWMHFRLGNIPIKLSLIVLFIMLPSTLLASYGITLLSSVDGWHDRVQWGINGLVVIAIALSLFIFCTRMFHPDRVAAQNVNQKRSLAAFIVPGTCAGITIGATGVGGGVVMLPLLMKYANMNIKHAIGTSVFVTMLLSGASAFAYGQGGYTDVRLALLLSAGSILSLPLARYLLRTVSEQAFQRLTFGFIVVSAVMMLYRMV
ncbi:Sulfite exporter TauE/SafE [Leminorella richardii]|uniref:Probable membrane transporter protein n=1 Tax=Leminorella richardii TaxID=158841 RepID=A0A2X4URE7_9GAMM|nr:sulfite exporter TauE/SafE family protein [Leminorella richardii]SQI41361.1 Sulfite exporter TauE/SafE [Leminorella richardii]